MSSTRLIGLFFLISAGLVPTAAGAEDLGSFLSDGAQFHIIGDPDHSALEHYQFRGSDAFISALEAAKIKTVFVEIPRKFQPLFDEVYNKAMSGDDFASAYYASGARFTGVSYEDQIDAARLTGEMAEKLARYKIKTIAFDTNGLITSKSGTTVQRLDPVYSCLIAEQTPGRGGSSPQLSGFIQAQWRERLAEDSLLADYIEKKAGSNKSIILIGALHLATAYGLDHLIHAKSIVMFGIGELHFYAVWLRESALDLGLDANHLPNGFLDISTLQITSNIPELSQISSAKGHWTDPCASRMEVPTGTPRK